MELALAACLGWVTTTWLLVRHLAEKDRHHALQLSGLLNRIQAPQEAVTQALVGDEQYETIILPHDEESFNETFGNGLIPHEDGQ